MSNPPLFFAISDVRMIEKVMDDDIYATCLPYIEADWTKSEAFDIMDMDKEVYKNSFQYQASFMAFRKSMRSIMFVEEWLNNCCNAQEEGYPPLRWQYRTIVQYILHYVP